MAKRHTTYAYARHSWLLSDETGYTASGLIDAFLDYCHYIGNESPTDSDLAGERLLVFNSPLRKGLRWRLLICGQNTGIKYAEIDLPVQNIEQFDKGPFELLAANLRIALNGWDTASQAEKEAFLMLVDQCCHDMPEQEADDEE